MAEEFLDCLGIPFDQHTRWLPNSTRDWPAPKGLGTSISDWRANWAGSPCWWCGHDTYGGLGLRRGEVHHLHGGLARRINEPWLFTWLCNNCHQGHGEAVKSESLGRLLWLKWLHDQPNTFWFGIALRLGRRLPDLEFDSVVKSAKLC